MKGFISPDTWGSWVLAGFVVLLGGLSTIQGWWALWFLGGVLAVAWLFVGMIGPLLGAREPYKGLLVVLVIGIISLTTTCAVNLSDGSDPYIDFGDWEECSFTLNRSDLRPEFVARRMPILLAPLLPLCYILHNCGGAVDELYGR